MYDAAEKALDEELKIIMMKEYVLEFISEVKLAYPNLEIRYNYDVETNEYNIWHNNKDIELGDKDFNKNIKKIAQKVFFSRNIYNFSFGYDDEKSEK